MRAAAWISAKCSVRSICCSRACRRTRLIGAVFAARIGPSAGRLAMSWTYSIPAIDRASAHHAFEQGPKARLEVAQDHARDGGVGEVDHDTGVLQDDADPAGIVARPREGHTGTQHVCRGRKRKLA